MIFTSTSFCCNRKTPSWYIDFLDTEYIFFRKKKSFLLDEKSLLRKININNQSYFRNIIKYPLFKINVSYKRLAYKYIFKKKTIINLLRRWGQEFCQKGFWNNVIHLKGRQTWAPARELGDSNLPSLDFQILFFFFRDFENNSKIYSSQRI